MGKASPTLDSLDLIIGARGDHEVAEHSLRIFSEVLPGDYHSAVYCDGDTLATDVYHTGAGWSGPASPMATFLQKSHLNHPFACHFLPVREPACYRRSEMVANQDWSRSEFYNELDRPMGIRDMVAIYQVTRNGDIIVLTCGRPNAFRQKDLDSVRPFHRILTAMLQARRRPGPMALSHSSGARSLSRREMAVMHWVREGKRNAEISVILGISTHTVRKHLENAFAKLGVETRTAAALLFSEDSRNFEAFRKEKVAFAA
jgi:DNA-binding CsgD family transcriptional regulator